MPTNRNPRSLNSKVAHLDANLGVVPLDINWLRLDPEKPRRPDDKSIQALAESIASRGVIHPIGVRKTGNRPEYVIISG
jgi:ParB-like chromosome segregation protein Spo0J